MHLKQEGPIKLNFHLQLTLMNRFVMGIVENILLTLPCTSETWSPKTTTNERLLPFVQL